VGRGVESHSPSLPPVELRDGPEQPVGGGIHVHTEFYNLLLDFVDGSSLEVGMAERMTFRLAGHGDGISVQDESPYWSFVVENGDSV